jgi:hypothetical protein
MRKLNSGFNRRARNSNDVERGRMVEQSALRCLARPRFGHFLILPAIITPVSLALR